MGWLFVSTVFWQNEFKDLVPGAIVQQLNVTDRILSREGVARGEGLRIGSESHFTLA
jgi:hypothetical protein